MEEIKKSSERVSRSRSGSGSRSRSRSRSGNRNGDGARLGRGREKKGGSPSSASSRSSPGRNSRESSLERRRRLRREGRNSRSSSRERFIRNREKSKSWLQHPGKQRRHSFGRRRTSPLYSRYGPRFNYLRNRSPRRQAGRFGPNRWGDRNSEFSYRRDHDNFRRRNRSSPRSSPERSRDRSLEHSPERSPERSPGRKRNQGNSPSKPTSTSEMIPPVEKSTDASIGVHDGMPLHVRNEPKRLHSDFEEKSEKGSQSGSYIDDVLNLIDSTSANLKLLTGKRSPSSSGDESSSNSSSSEPKKRKHKSKSRKKQKKEKKKKHKKSDRSESKSKSRKKTGDSKSKSKCPSKEAEELLKLITGPNEITTPQSVSSKQQQLLLLQHERIASDGPSTSGDYKSYRSDSGSRHSGIEERKHLNDHRKRDSGQRSESDSRKRQRQS